MKPLTELTPAELERRKRSIARRSEIINDAMIAAGRGFEKPTETRTKTDALSARWRECSDAWIAVVAEEQRRITYHGNTRRTR